MIFSFVKGQSIEMENTEIVSDTINYLQMQCVFMTSDWKNMRIWAHFMQDDKEYYTVELNENYVTPYLHLPSGEWSVYIHGEKHENGTLTTRIVSDKATFSITKSAMTNGIPFPDPSPSELERIHSSIGNLENLETNDKSSLVNAINEVYRKGGTGGGGSGADGFSPIVDITEIEGGHRVTITDAEGEKTFDVLDAESYVLTESDKEEIKNSVLDEMPEGDYISIKDYGATGDGITNDTESIKRCLAENDYIYFPRGRYRMTEPLEINRDNITIVGEGGTEGGETYGKTRIEFESCDGIVFNSGRNITFNGVSVWAKDTANENCAFKFQASNTMHKVQISNCMIFNFKYGMSESLGDISCTIWNCSFKHIKTQNVEYAVYFAQTSNQENHFGILFEDFYSDNGKMYLRYGKYTFLNCNFGIRTTHYMQLQNSCYTLWVNCNFECDETIPFDETIAARENHCIELNGKGHLFIGCQFAVKGESKDGKNVFLIDTKTDLRLLKFINCYSWTDGVATIWYTMGDTGEAGCITFVGNGMDKPNWTGSYQVGYHTNVDSGLINAHENFISSFPDNFVYWQYGNKEIRYYKDGIVYDSHGNDIATRKKPPVKIGAGFYLDFGEIEVTGSAVTVTYNRQVDGQVSVTTPPIIDGVPIMIFRDMSDEHKDKTYYARFQIRMWDDANKSWVDNTKAFTLKWAKISL